MAFLAILSIFIISIIIICFLSGIEIAFISANKLSIELARKQGTYSGKTWGGFSEHPTKFIGTILVAINIVLVVYGLVVGHMLEPLWERLKEYFPASAENYIDYIKIIFETVLSAAIILLLIVGSRAFFQARNHLVVKNGIISYFARFFSWLFSGISLAFISFSEWFLKTLLNVKLTERQEMFSKVDLENFIQQMSGANEEDSSEINKELFENALSLGDVKLRECLVPRKEIVGINQDSTIEEVKAKFIETQLSKLIVMDHDIDNITGYIHQLDLFKQPAAVKDILLPIPTVPESMSVTALIDKFTKERKTIAWVIDEFGGTAGIVTMEDLLEEIFGEIHDEYDDIDEFVNKQLSHNEYLFSGRMELDYITEKYGLEFKTNEDVETLSGFIIQHHDAIPAPKERIIAGNYEFDILAVSSGRIETVKLKVLR